MKTKLRKVFIDTEFTNLIEPELISLGLVAETGEEAYFEVSYDQQKCSDFVREVVVPLLGKDEHALVEKALLHLKVAQWLRIIKEPNQLIEICYDHDYDWQLFQEVMGQVPWIVPRNINYEVSLLLLDDFYASRKLAEHFALNDARANAYAFRERNIGN